MREGRNKIHNNSIAYKSYAVKRNEHKKRNLKLKAWVTGFIEKRVLGMDTVSKRIIFFTISSS